MLFGNNFFVIFSVDRGEKYGKIGKLIFRIPWPHRLAWSRTGDSQSSDGGSNPPGAIEYKIRRNSKQVKGLRLFL